MKKAPVFLVRITKIIVFAAFVLCLIFFDKFSFEIGSINRVKCYFIGMSIALIAVIVYFNVTKRSETVWFQILSLALWASIAIFLLTINSIYNQRREDLLNRETPNSGVVSVQLSLHADYYSASGTSYVNKKSVRDPSMQINNKTIRNGNGTVEVELGEEYTAEFFVGLLQYNGSTTKTVTFTKAKLDKPMSFEVDVYLGGGYSAVITVNVKKSISLTPFELVFGSIG